MRAIVLTFSALLLSFGAVGCGDDGGGASSCSSVSARLCEKACSCGGCAVGDESGGFSFDTVGDCKAFFSLGCSAGGAYATPDACLTAIDEAQCISVSGDQGIDVGTACDAEEK